MSLQAVHRGELDDNYFLTLMQILPYNKFTLTVRRHCSKVRTRQDELIEELKQGIEDRMPDSRNAYEEAMAKWKIEHAKWAEENPGVESSQPMDIDGDTAKDDEVQVTNSTERACAPLQGRYAQASRQLHSPNANSSGRNRSATPCTNTSRSTRRSYGWPTRKRQLVPSQ
jgi:hypothetical protein